ncbi:MAG: baseplate J/gp47 family protein [Marinagarivorans sp.]|nr:baseplate J/gp47 family protein [Marinagarivorans sp.]
MALINTESIGLYTPLIDGRNEETLYRAAQNVVAAASLGALNDFSDHGPLGVLLRAQAWAIAELLFAINDVPLAMAIKMLELTGEVRRLGSNAKASLTFTLTSARPVPYQIPKGFEVLSASGDRSFYTDALLTIPAGRTSGSVSATAKEAGERYNLPGYSLTQFTQPLTFLGSVTNVQAAQGGSAAETVESAIERGLLALRNRAPVSAADFENQAQSVLGEGSRAKAIGLLGPDAITEQIGAVHIFCLSATGEPANPALQSAVISALSPRIMLGTSLYVSAMQTLEIEAAIIIHLLPGVEAKTVADALWQAFSTYLSPAAYLPGDALLLNELAYQFRFVSGIEFIDELRINGGLQNIPMPNDYTLPVAYSLSVQAVDSEGNIISTLRGAGESPEFDPEP